MLIQVSWHNSFWCLLFWLFFSSHRWVVFDVMTTVCFSIQRRKRVLPKQSCSMVLHSEGRLGTCPSTTLPNTNLQGAFQLLITMSTRSWAKTDAFYSSHHRATINTSIWREKFPAFLFSPGHAFVHRITPALGSTCFCWSEERQSAA